MKKIIFPLILFLSTTVFVRAQSTAVDDEDVQFWPDLTVSVGLTPRTSLNFFGTLRPGDDLSRIVSEQAGVGINFRAHKNLTLFSGYRAVWSQPEENRHNFEHRLIEDVIPRFSLGKKFTVSDRNRLERRDINGRWSWRYRNRLQIEHPIKIHERQLTAYVSGEYFYDSRFSQWNRKQFWIGTKVPLTKHFSWDLFYSANMDKRAPQGYWHIIGMFTRLEF